MKITSYSPPVIRRQPVRKNTPSRIAQLAEATGKTLSTPFLMGCIGPAYPCRLAREGIEARHQQPAADRQEFFNRLKDDASDVAFAAALSALTFPIGFLVGVIATPIVAREEFGAIQW